MQLGINVQNNSATAPLYMLSNLYENYTNLQSDYSTSIIRDENLWLVAVMDNSVDFGL